MNAQFQSIFTDLPIGDTLKHVPKWRLYTVTHRAQSMQTSCKLAIQTAVGFHRSYISKDKLRNTLLQDAIKRSLAWMCELAKGTHWPTLMSFMCSTDSVQQGMQKEDVFHRTL